MMDMGIDYALQKIILLQEQQLDMQRNINVSA